MKKIMAGFVIASTLFFPLSANAIGWKQLVDAIAQMYGLDLKTNQLNADQLDTLKDIQGSLTGTHNYGKSNYDKNANSWGENSSDWQQILSLSKNGGGSGELGNTIADLSKEFPISGSLNSPNKVENDYYNLQARTALSSRSASEVAYKQAVREEKTLKSLHGMIDKTEDEKSASDLNNRMASEAAMTSVQQTKLLSVLVQQAAVNAQEKANRAKEDMEFFATK
jgi:hypothetical protein